MFRLVFRVFSLNHCFCELSQAPACASLLLKWCSGSALVISKSQGDIGEHWSSPKARVTLVNTAPFSYVLPVRLPLVNFSTLDPAIPQYSEGVGLSVVLLCTLVLFSAILYTWYLSVLICEHGTVQCYFVRMVLFSAILCTWYCSVLFCAHGTVQCYFVHMVLF